MSDLAQILMTLSGLLLLGLVTDLLGRRPLDPPPPARPRLPTRFRLASGAG